MRTTLDLDEGLLDRVLKRTAEASKSKAVNRAMREYLKRTAIDELRSMAGKRPVEDVRAENRGADAMRERALDELGSG